MSTTDETPDTAVRGAQTVAPVQASALLFAASVLGEASYTPDQELKGTLATARGQEEPVETPQRAGVVPPVRVEPPVAEVEPVVEPVRKGFFARLLDKLLGR